MIGGGDEDEEIDTGADGEGTEGQDTAAGQQAGDLPAEHADQAEDDGEPEVVAGEDGDKPSRGQARFQRLANERATEKARADRLEQELQEARRAQWQRQDQLTEQQERERLALMTPDERADYRIDQSERRTAHQLRQMQMQTAATMDKTAFDAKATINPVYAKFASEVESRFAEQMRQGRPVEREILLKMILGERALSGAATTGKARRQGASRVDAQRVAPGSGKGDAASERGKAGDNAEKRLQGVHI